MISQATIDILKQTADILDVCDTRLTLKKSGANFKAPCPFHGEKTASFVVSPQKQIFHCFGCGIGGDSIKFIMEYERLTYPEAIRSLCEQYDIPVIEDNSAPKVSNSMLEQYSNWCQSNLQANTQAKTYLLNRGVTEQSLIDFELGFSPSSAEVIAFVKDNVLNLQECIELGIVDNGERGLYARFIDRIMFPIKNHQGKICGFSGRTTVNHPAKYVNTKETPLFNKSRIIYGFEKAKDFLKDDSAFILVEGHLDVVMMHQAGIKETIGSMGTAFTKEHIKLLTRYTKKGVIAYDGDRAGVEAAFKAAKLSTEQLIDTSVVIFEEGVDPADLVADNKTHIIKRMLQNGIGAIPFCVSRVCAQFDISNPFEKSKALEEVQKLTQNTNEVISRYIVDEGRKILGDIAIEIQSPQSSVQSPTYTKIPITNITIELSIIKAAIVDGTQECVDKIALLKKCFANRMQVECLARMDFANTLLTSIYLDDSIQASENIDVDLKLFKIWCLKQYIQKVTTNGGFSNLQKIEKIREAQTKISEIETGIST